MDNEQLLGRYARLRRDLGEAYTAPEWHADHIDRIARELVETEHELAVRQTGDEPSGQASS